MEKEVSIIIPMRDEGIHVYDTIKSIRENTSDVNYEIIVVDDGSIGRNYSDLTRLDVRYFRTEMRGAARARNFGTKYSTAENLVFLDAHMKLCREWLSRMINVVKKNRWSFTIPTIYDTTNPYNKGYGLTFKSWALDYTWLNKKSVGTYEVPLGTCACAVVSRKVFDMVGGFDQGIKGFGLEEEIFLRAWLLGFKVIIEPNVEVGHLFKTKFTYEVVHSYFIMNVLRLACSHFNEEAITRVVALWKHHPNFKKAFLLNIFSDVWFRRMLLFRKRIFDDNWFFNKFKVNL